MNRGLAIVGTFIVVTAIGCNPPEATGSTEAAVTNPDVACDIHGCISISKFSQSLSSLLANKVEGYVSIVGAQPPAFGGYARNAADAPSWSPGGIAMLPDLPTNIASVSKTLTTIGVLRSLARHNISLDSPISPYLWSTWHQGSNIGSITFR
ncbi:MAG TPA: serine hydrolase, partial [Polyangia bacterium]